VPVPVILRSTNFGKNLGLWTRDGLISIPHSVGCTEVVVVLEVSVLVVDIDVDVVESVDDVVGDVVDGIDDVEVDVGGMEVVGVVDEVVVVTSSQVTCFSYVLTPSESIFPSRPIVSPSHSPVIR
jgi:hypothetical protein